MQIFYKWYAAGETQKDRPIANPEVVIDKANILLSYDHLIKYPDRMLRFLRFHNISQRLGPEDLSNQEKVVWSAAPRQRKERKSRAYEP